MKRTLDDTISEFQGAFLSNKNIRDNLISGIEGLYIMKRNRWRNGNEWPLNLIWPRLLIE